MDTGTAPSVGQRIVVLGGLIAFDHMTLPDDGFASDTIWRSTHGVIWSAALRTACQRRLSRGADDDDVGHNEMPTKHTGVRARHQIQRSRPVMRQRRIQFYTKYLGHIEWPNAVRPCRSRILDLGHRGKVGRAAFRSGDCYPGSSSFSVQSQVDDEDFTGNLTCGIYGNRIEAGPW